MTQSVSASEANRAFSALLRRARRGETVAITSRGETVAYLVPKDAASGEREKRRAVLQAMAEAAKARPVGNIGPWTRDELYD